MPPYAEGRVHTYVVAMAKISRIASQKRPFSLNSQCGRCIIPGRAFRMHGRGSQFREIFCPKRAPRNALPARQNTSGATRLARRETNGAALLTDRAEDERYSSPCRQARRRAVQLVLPARRKTGGAVCLAGRLENEWCSSLGGQAGRRVVQHGSAELSQIAFCVQIRSVVVSSRILRPGVLSRVSWLAPVVDAKTYT